jgi:hypothetical protein
MTVSITVLAAVVALAAAVRSTWSPCGLSMLSTITPLSERAKGHSYRSTAGWFILGAVAGGATLGAVVALAAAGVDALDLGPTTAGSVALVAALICAVSDAGVLGRRLPVHRRQVNERWLDRYRPWVYASGFGWQIGTGLATYITTAAVYLMIALGALSGRPEVALAVGTAFGLLRGTAVLLTRNLRTADQLRSFHRRFTAAGPSVGRAVTGVEACSALMLAVALGSPSALVVVAVALAAASVAALTRGRNALTR